MARKPKPDTGTPESQAPHTQRAYTLRLRGPDPADNAWRDALWATHEAINAGAKVFGDWLLTLRGGLCHTLAEPPPPAKDKDRSAEEAAAIRKNRRVLLALSWLSVEDARGAPDGEGIRVATGKQSSAERERLVLESLRSILAGRGLSKPEIDSWASDCTGSLAARIRDDAVWINRSACFDATARTWNLRDRSYAGQTIMHFFGPEDEYFKLPDISGEDEAQGGISSDGPEFRTVARQWVSTNFGTGVKSDNARIIQALTALRNLDLSPMNGRAKSDVLTRMGEAIGFAVHDADELRAAVGWSTGRPSKGRLAIDNLPDYPIAADLALMQQKLAEEAADKQSKAGTRDKPEWMQTFQSQVEQTAAMPFVGKRNHIGEYSVMLDHAARRVSIGHSWIKRAEAQRLHFEQDAARLAGVPRDAAAWLDAFIVERSGAAGGDYRIRRRAIEGWDKVVERWAARGCATAADRVAAARGLQDDPEIDKFGDIQLFEALAADDAVIVWQRGGRPDAAALKDYVLGHDARFRQQHYKVPAYRHPDPLRHPVFGDFGNSRWDIAYAAHEAAKAAGSKRAPDAQTAAWLRDRHGLRLGLWDGLAVREVPLRWSSKRLSNDLALNLDRAADTIRAVTRADRLGRAAAGLEAGEVPTAAGLFALDDWNGRLQAPRPELDAIAQRIERFGWDAKAKAMRGRLSWLVSFSAKLECRGPFIEYVHAFDPASPDRPFIAKKSGELAVAHDGNDARKSLAKLGLARLPGLRVLSVDLGHRFAASCAVWEAISDEQFKQECEGRAISAGSAAGVFCHTLHNDEQGMPRTTIYRRIGADTLADGTPHPAPWARLERQFLIKVQGEEQAPRRASADERNAVRKFEDSIGRQRSEDDLPRRVDALMAEAVRTARLGLYRHGDAARIAYAFMPGSKRHTPGGGTEEHSPETRTAAMLDALVRWHGVRGDARSRWRDERAQSAWDTHIAPRLSAALPEPAEDASGPERKAHRRKIEEALSNLAAELAARGEAGVPELFDLWRTRWEADHAQWPSHLKRLNRWLLPRSLHASMNETTEQTQQRKARLGAARNVGGLSLTRIATIRELWQAQKAFHYGARPCDPRAGVRTIEEDSASGRKFGAKALRTMERMREQRVKQIASRIAASALGLGGHWKEVVRRDHAGRPVLDEHGEQRTKRVWVEEPNAKYAPCHAIVIENLRNYRPDELQTRRENKALMTWSSAKVAKYLGEACQLNGLHLREVSPNYTSRQCSRTGLPGLRCVDVKVNPDTGEPDVFWWKKTLAIAEKKAGANGDAGDSESRFIVALSRHLKAIKDSGGTLPRTVRLPRRGGDLFVAAPAWDDLRRDGFRAGAAVQADLNAAANIGLRALLDPDFAGRWWYVPCEAASGRPANDKCAGSAALDLDKALIEPRRGDTEGTKATKGRGKAKDLTNAWRDVGRQDGWNQHAPYWNGVAARVMERLRLANSREDRSTTRPGDDIETPF